MTSKGAINVETLIVNAKREKQQIIVKYFLIFVRFCSSEIFKNNIWLEVKNICWKIKAVFRNLENFITV